MSLPIDRILITCEHGRTAVPREFADLFRGRARLLESHRGHDRGALELARVLARRFGAPLVVAPYTRLLVDANRTRRRRSLFSPITRALSPETRERIVTRYFEPHRAEVLRHVRASLRRRRLVLHLGVHTFAPVVRGVRRRSDVSLLYDPARANEVELCRAWRRELRRGPRLYVRFNYPFLGKNDGLTTWLRRRFDDRRYLGIEIEVNDRFHRNGAWGRICRDVAASLERTLNGTPPDRPSA